MLIEPLFVNASQRGQELAVIDDFGQVTWETLARMTAGLSMFLSMQDTKPTVGILLPPGAAFVASFYGTLLAGKTVTPINFLLGEREIAHVIADSGVELVLTIGPLMDKVAHLPVKAIDVAELAKQLPAMAEHIPMPPKIPERKASDLAVLMYTSGTAGLPKGVILTYGNLLADVQASITHGQLDGTHVFLGMVPLFHTTGMLATLLAPVTLGSLTVYIARFNPSAVLEAARKHKVSLMVGVPSMYAAIARARGDDQPLNIYAALSGGEPLPASVAAAWLERFKAPIYEGYGLTETIGPIAFNVPGAIKSGSVGRAIPGAVIRIVDDNDKDLPQGEDGEIWLGGPMLSQGYNNLPDETNKAYSADGFFKTGDLGHVDSDGYLFVTGRKKDLIIVAGEKAAPREIEEVLMKHPSVADAAVVGKKDALRGEVVVAFVIAQSGQTVEPTALREFARAAGLPQWKIPREVIVTQSLPRSPTGKVLKRVLAEQANAAR